MKISAECAPCAGHPAGARKWLRRRKLAQLAFVANVGLMMVCPNSTRAADARDTLTIVFENDLFYHTDRDYTNGLEATWSPGEHGTAALPSFLRDLPAFLGIPDSRASYSLGQMMFTPEDTPLIDPPKNERPYGGFLYAAMALTDEADAGKDEWRIQLGTTGPASLAADSQILVHRIRGIPLPLGWHTQLRDEPGLVVRYQRTRNVAFSDDGNTGPFELKLHFGGAAGNVFDYLNAGATARLGFNLPADDGPPRIEPAAPGSYFYEPQAGIGAYLFAGVESRFVARNLFLDGNSFAGGPQVQKEWLVGDLSVGGAIAFPDFRLSFVHMFRSREYASQKGADQFGTLSLSANF